MKKHNPTDLTLRNLRAHAKRIAALERECKSLRTELNDVRTSANECASKLYRVEATLKYASIVYAK